MSGTRITHTKNNGFKLWFQNILCQAILEKLKREKQQKLDRERELDTRQTKYLEMVEAQPSLLGILKRK